MYTVHSRKMDVCTASWWFENSVAIGEEIEANDAIAVWEETLSPAVMDKDKIWMTELPCMT